MIAVTLPDDAIDRLHRVHRDLGWAIVNLLDQRPSPAPVVASAPDCELVAVAGRRSAIVVNRDVFGALAGVHLLPLDGDRALLTVDEGRGMSDLELSVVDRLAQPGLDRRERLGLRTLRRQLMAWRRDPALEVHTSAIILVERRARGALAPPARAGAPRRPARRPETAA